ncbi:MAG: hypothetical protein ACRC4O_03055, partial [Giesbergeria sp.]
IEGALSERMIDRAEAREGKRLAAEVGEARRHVSITLDDLSACARAEPADAPPSLAAVLSALPHLTGDELRRVAVAMPRVAGEWVDRIGRLVERWERIAVCGNAAACVRHVRNDDGWGAETTDPYEHTWHPTARAAQAACDARLEAAGVRLCGEVVRDG